MTYYDGLDVSLRSVAICIIDDEGKIHSEISVPSEVEDIASVLEAFDGDIVSVGLEAGTLDRFPQRSMLSNNPLTCSIFSPGVMH